MKHKTQFREVSSSHFILQSPYVRKYKGILDSGLHAVDSRFQVLDSSFCQWNLNSGFQSFVGFRILWAVFRIPEPRIPDSTSKIFPDFLIWGDCNVHLIYNNLNNNMQKRWKRVNSQKQENTFVSLLDHILHLMSVLINKSQFTYLHQVS